MSKRTKAYLALLTTAIIWGLAPPIIKYTLGFTTPIEFLFWRFLMVCPLILPVFILKFKKQPFQSKDLPRLLLVAFCGTSLTLCLLFFGLDKTTSVDAAVLSATTPIMIVIGGVLFLKEIITKQEKVGLAIAVLGALIATVSPLINGRAFTGQSITGNLLIFSSNLTWATYTILGKRLSKKYPSFNITALAFFVGLITFIPLFFYQRMGSNQPFFYLNPQAIPGIIYMALLGSIVAYFTYTYGVGLIEASEATLFTYLQPVFTLPLAVLWLGETVSRSFIFGAVFIIIGVFLTEYKPGNKEVKQKK